jgi:hypothetical protein
MESKGLEVDHFRPVGSPKSGPNYWWLAYDPGNYLFACTFCNAHVKHDQFPLQEGAPRVTWETRSTLSGERRILLDPSSDIVENLFDIDDDGWLIPSQVLAPAHHEQVQSVIDFFRLNTDPLTRRSRLKIVDDSLRAVRDEDWGRLRQLAVRHREHSLVAWLILRDAVPEQLPGPAEELRDRIRMLWQDLRLQVAENLRAREEGKKVRPFERREVESIYWALIVLQNDPPGGPPELVEDVMAELFAQEPEAAVQAEIRRGFRSLQQQTLRRSANQEIL